MSGGVSNPDREPVGVPDEAMLLAWIEGEPLPARDELLVAEHLRANPTLAKRLEAMRVDREALCSMEEQGAPADLLQRVGSQVVPLLERRMLLTDAPVVTRKLRLVRAQRPSLVRTLFLESTGRRIMAAAAVLLFTGAGVYFAANSMSGRNTGRPADPSSPGGIARDKDGGFPDPKIALLPHRDSSPNRDQPAVPIPHDEDKGDVTALAMSAGDPNAPWTLPGLVESERYAREQGIITPSVAIELAQQGNLVVRVRGTDASIDPTLLKDLLREGSSWQVAEDQSDEQLLSPEAVKRNMEGIAPQQGGMLADMGAAPSGVFILRTRLDTGTLASLCDRLASARAQVTFERQDRAIETEQFAMHTGAPRRIVAPPGWSAVPVIIEQAPGN